MKPSSRTPEGSWNRCPVCGKSSRVEPTREPGDAPCPHCGHLLWYRVEAQESEAEVLWRQAVGLMGEASYDFDEVIEILQYAVKLEPGEARYRRWLRKAEYAKFAQRTGESLESRGEIERARAELEDAKRAEDWDKVDWAAEECLKYNPWDGRMHMELGNACRKRGLREAAVFAYECAVHAEPEVPGARAALEELARG